MPADWIRPDWPAPGRVRACVSTRRDGTGRAPYGGFNLALHVGDDPARVETNRRRLCRELGLSREPLWLHQVHGFGVVRAEDEQPGVTADAAVSRTPGIACAVLTADCLPVLLCDRAGSVVAAAHAGWRGLAAGVLEHVLTAMQCSPGEVLAWLGPGIGPAHFEVGEEVRQAFTQEQPEAETAFRRGRPGKWFADLYGLARLRLARAGVDSVHGGGFCTFEDTARFYSYRRERDTGRMASLVWLQAPDA